MTLLEEYGQLLEEVECAIKKICHLPNASVGCAAGCAECCTSPSLLPLEAMVLLESCGELPVPAKGRPDRCPLLTEDRLCAAYPARPLVCRVRGFPVDSVDEDGLPLRENCAKNSFPQDLGEFGAMHLAEWNARLYGITARFCALTGIPLYRMKIQDVYRPGGLPALRLSVNSSELH
jgi:hypothetical protein